MKYEGNAVPPWKLGEFWSSADPRKKVLMVAAGKAQIIEYSDHRDFVRWVASSDDAARKDALLRQAMEALEFVNVGFHAHCVESAIAAIRAELSGEQK